MKTPLDTPPRRPAPPESGRRRQGLVLVLALCGMGLLVLTALSLAGLLRIETRLCRDRAELAQARLNALMSARLALAHLQQEAGPDQRATALGELAGLPAAASLPSPWPRGTPAAARLPQGRAQWTGVWRCDEPDQPPAWLVSGKGGGGGPGESRPPLAQSVSLSGCADYTPEHWAPWQKDYPRAFSGERMVALVGAGSAPPEAGPDGALGTADDIDRRVALPRLSFPGGGPGEEAGGFAYWIGDEGVKAWVDPKKAAADSFVTQTRWSAGVLADSHRGGLRRDLSLAFEMDDRDFDRSEYGDGSGEPSGQTHATELFTTWTNPVTGSPERRRSWHPGFPSGADGGPGAGDPRPRLWVPIWERNPDNPGRDLGSDGSRHKAWSPVFLREDEAGNDLRSHTEGTPILTLNPGHGQPRRLTGPLWHLLRDYHRLCKELDWANGVATLGARGFFPNQHQLTQGGYRPTAAANPRSRYGLDQAHWPDGGLSGDRPDARGDTPDPLGVPNGLKEFRPMPRAVRGAYLPVLHRLSLVFSVHREPVGAHCALRATCAPLVVLHNPYDVRLRLAAAGVPEPDPRAAGAAARVTFTQLRGVSIYARTHVGNDPSDPRLETRGVRADALFSLRTEETDPGAENLGALIPATVLEPGEMAVFSARETIAAGTASVDGPGTGAVIRLERGLFPAGGIHAGLVTHALSATSGTPDGRTAPVWPRYLGPGVDPARPLGGSVSMWIGCREMHWHCWLHLRSGWRQSLAGDRVGGDLGEAEVVGTSRRNSQASQGLMVNVGSIGAEDGHLFFGDPGNEAAPVALGPTGEMRAFAPGVSGHVIGVIDTRMRLADAARTTSHDRMALSWKGAQAAPVPAPNPSWLLSNPVAQSSAAPSVPTASGTLPSIGSPSLRTQMMGGDELGLEGKVANWDGLLRTDPARPGGVAALGGFSHGAGGVARAIHVSIPTEPPLSLGQFTHANVSAWGWFPYRTVGNSLPPLVTPLDKSWTQGPGAHRGGQTFADMAWLMNNALWDAFFLSGAGPRLGARREGGYNDVREETVGQALDAFAAGERRLGNTRLRLLRPCGQPPAAAAFATPGFLAADGEAAPDGHRRLAGYLLSDGALNVNSLSAEAWLGALRSAFPRSADKASRATARDIRNPDYWAAPAEPDDGQLQALAEGIAAEVRARALFHARGEREQERPPSSRRFRGFPEDLEPGTPFLGLAEFVNRFLGPTRRPGALLSRDPAESRSLYTPGILAEEAPEPPYDGRTESRRWMLRSGALESAIARADQALGARGPAAPPVGAAMIVASVSHNWGHLAPDGRRSGMPPALFPRNVETLAPETNAPRSHTGFGARGCLSQADLLSALGPLLAARSDTFVIRAHGDSGRSAAALELVAQRLPEFVDARDAPETRLSDARMRPANRALGRRFRVVAVRWLGPGET